MSIQTLFDRCQLTESWHREPALIKDASVTEAVLDRSVMEDAQREICLWQDYAATSIYSLDKLADLCGVASVHYKDESARFGLGSFKALGGAYAVLKYLSENLSDRLNKSLDIQSVLSGEFEALCRPVTVTSATDGNHGRSVAWGAQKARCGCVIYIHRDVSEGRERALAELGAKVVRIDGDYDESVRRCALDADEQGWQVISDTSWDGYRDIPESVMAGYTLMVAECLQQLEHVPTHVIVQAGVGGLAAAVCTAFKRHLGKQAPVFIIVESQHADCVLKSFRQDAPATVVVERETVMAGLSCGEISLLAWQLLPSLVSSVITLPDDQVPATMHAMAEGLFGSDKIEAGECAVPGVIGLMSLVKDATLIKDLELTPDSRVLLFGCEGATDAELYQSLLAIGKQSLLDG